MSAEQKNARWPEAKRAQVIEAGFIQARNLSSSDFFIALSFGLAKLKV
jgi:hypothetical protein